jgi:hypothetical protein
MFYQKVLKFRIVLSKFFTKKKKKRSKRWTASKSGQEKSNGPTRVMIIDSNMQG